MKELADQAGNFAFLAKAAPELTRLGQLAEHFFLLDPPTSLIKTRQFAELTAKDIAARHGELPDTHATFDEALRALQRRGLLQRQIAGLFFYIKRVGNAAVHENAGTRSEALEALKMARLIGSWFHQVYNRAPNFRAGPFVPPQPPEDATPALREEIEALRKAVSDSADAEAKARMAAQEAIAGQATLQERAARSLSEYCFCWVGLMSRRQIDAPFNACSAPVSGGCGLCRSLPIRLGPDRALVKGTAESLWPA